MSITSFKVLRAVGVNSISAAVNAALADGMQPFGAPMLDASRDTYAQAMVAGTPDSGGLPEGSVAVADGDTVAVVNSAGAESHNATAAVASDTLTNVKLADTVALVDDAQALTVPVTGNYVDTITPTVADGVITGFVLS